jgi:transcriptional regulator with XRE-family HTH domain
MEFHEKLQELRKHKGLTQEELARALFISRTAVSKWESGRGYPNIDSLRAIAKFYGITLDELLSGDELLLLAEEDGRQRGARFCDLTFGLLDISMLLLFFLPFFATKGGAAATLFILEGIRPYLKALFFIAVSLASATGVLLLALQNVQTPLWAKNKYILSFAVSTGTTLLFILTRQPYAAAFAFSILTVKAIMLIKAQ